MHPLPSFPIARPRRLRRSPELRALVQETRLTPDDFIYPLFVVPGEGIRTEIAAMPGQYHLSVDEAVKEAELARADGVKGIILFGLPDDKDAEGSSAYAEQAPVQQALRAIRSAVPNLILVTDVCLCQYTDHGHCGPLVGHEVDNDAALKVLARTALSHAQAGADIVAPSDMMDGRVQAIRAELDAHGFQQVSLLSYAVKFASAYYGPFREAAHSTPSFGDRRSYQMDPANRRESLREAQHDIAEGADMLMVKPALCYLDILRDLRETTLLPLAAYNVSGEYSMIKAASRAGWIDEDRVVLETLLSIKRAGADLILTYFARQAARLL